MHDLLFRSQARFGSIPWVQLAIEAGVPDSVKFAHCFASSQYRRLIERDLDVADSLRINATPALLINGKLFIGAIPASQLEKEIASALRQ